MEFLGSGIPKFISDVAFFILCASLVTTFVRVVSDGGKEKGSITTDGALQAAPFVYIVYVIVSYLFRASYLYNVYYWILNIIFVLLCSSVGFGLIIIFCKFNFTEELAKDKDYKSNVLKIKDNRTVGLLMSAVTLVLCRMAIEFYFKSHVLFTITSILGVISAIVCCYFYSSNRTIENKANKKSKTLVNKEKTGDEKTNEEEKSSQAS